MNDRTSQWIATFGAVAALLVASGCELQIDMEGTTTTYSQPFWTGPLGMLLGALVTIAGVLFFRSRLPYAIRKYGIAAAAIGIVFIVLGVGVMGTYVEVSAEGLRGSTGVIWERKTYDIRYDELREIHLVAEPVDETDEHAVPGFLYRFVFRSGEELQVRKEAYLKAAEEEFLDHARAHGVRIVRDRS